MAVVVVGSKLHDDFNAWAEANAKWSALLMLVVLFVVERMNKRSATGTIPIDKGGL
jgi:hypothetical protein